MSYGTDGESVRKHLVMHRRAKYQYTITCRGRHYSIWQREALHFSYKTFKCLYKSFILFKTPCSKNDFYLSPTDLNGDMCKSLVCAVVFLVFLFSRFGTFGRAKSYNWIFFSINLTWWPQLFPVRWQVFWIYKGTDLFEVHH